VPFLVRAGGGIVASQAELSWWPEQKVAVIPAAFLAAGFGPGHILYPASGAALRCGGALRSAGRTAPFGRTAPGSASASPRLAPVVGHRWRRGIRIRTTARRGPRPRGEWRAWEALQPADGRGGDFGASLRLLCVHGADVQRRAVTPL
jgi:hypothetical protein